MTGSLLLRGMLVGVLAGVLAFLFAYKFGEPQVDLAIAFEEQMSAAEEAAAPPADGAMVMEEPELVSRATQATTGLLTGLVGYGAAVGGIFSLVFAYAYGRLGALGARATSAMPMEPPAPPRFSSTTGCLRMRASDSCRLRAVMSVAPPGGNGTMMRRGLPSCAKEIPGAKDTAASAESR